MPTTTTGDPDTGEDARSTSGTRRLYDQLRSQILAGNLDDTDVLYETTVASAFGVSRTPVREALARLVDEGLLTRQARGCRVAHRTPEEIIEIFDVRTALERAVAEIAASRCTDFDIAALESIFREAQTLVDSLDTASNSDAVSDAVQRLNKKWHQQLLMSTRHSFLIHQVDGVMNLQAMYDGRMPVRGHADLAGALSEHAAITEALRDRDSQRAADAMTHHLTEVRASRVREFVRNSSSQ